jgi:hypothetical protein
VGQRSLIFDLLYMICAPTNRGSAKPPAEIRSAIFWNAGSPLRCLTLGRGVAMFIMRFAMRSGPVGASERGDL